jgi:hypothetical protein
MTMFRPWNFCLLNIRVGGHKALAEVVAEFVDAKRAAGQRNKYLRVQASVLGFPRKLFPIVSPISSQQMTSSDG